MAFDKEKLMSALRNAHSAGDESAARRIAGMIKAQEEAPQVEPAPQPQEATPEAEPPRKRRLTTIGTGPMKISDQAAKSNEAADRAVESGANLGMKVSNQAQEMNEAADQLVSNGEAPEQAPSKLFEETAKNYEASKEEDKAQTALKAQQVKSDKNYDDITKADWLDSEATAAIASGKNDNEKMSIIANEAARLGKKVDFYNDGFNNAVAYVDGKPFFVDDPHSIGINDVREVAGRVGDFVGGSTPIGAAASEAAKAGIGYAVDKFAEEHGGDKADLGRALVGGAVNALAAGVGAKVGDAATKATAPAQEAIRAGQERAQAKAAIDNLEKEARTLSEGEVMDAIAKSNGELTPDLARVLRLDPNKVERLEAAGLSVDEVPLSSIVEDGRVSAVLSGLEKRTGSDMAEKLSNAQKSLTNRYESLIEEAGGDLDTGRYNDQLYSKIKGEHRALRNQENQLYNEVNSVVDPQTVVDTSNIEKTLKEHIDQAGRNASPMAVKMYNDVKAGEYKYGELDALIKNLNKNYSLVADPTFDQALAGKIRTEARRDQMAALEQHYPDQSEKMQQAIELSKQRFSVQDQKKLYENKAGDYVTTATKKAQSKINTLANGPGEFETFIKAVPKDEQKSLLMTTFANSVKTKDGGISIAKLSNSVGNWPQSSRNSIANVIGKDEAKQLFALADSAKILKDTAAKSAKNGHSLELINDFFDRFEETKLGAIATKALSMMIDTGAASVSPSGLATVGGLTGNTLGGAVAKGLAKASKKRRQLNNISSLFSRKDLARGLEAARANSAGRAKINEKSLMESKAYKDFYRSLPVVAQKQITKIGFLAWASQYQSNARDRQA